MESTITINVTTDCFKNATGYLDNEYCPLALAIKQQLNIDRVSVGGSNVDIDNVRYNFDSYFWNCIFIVTLMAKAKQGVEVDTVEVILTKAEV